MVQLSSLWIRLKRFHKTVIFHDDGLLRALWVSAKIAFWVTLVRVLLSCTNAVLFERLLFRGNEFLYLLMLLPSIFGAAAMAFLMSFETSTPR